jgi:hypothetical protein
VTPNPPKVDISRNPNEEQLAQVLERTLKDEPENNDRISTFKSIECFMTYTFMHTTTPARTAVIFEIINPPYRVHRQIECLYGRKERKVADQKH